MSERVVVEVTAFEALGADDPGSRRALVRWSDGSTGEALRWYHDLWGCPHKSSYADTRVMPRGSEGSPMIRGNEAAVIGITG